jgi:hypothetical protein
MLKVISQEGSAMKCKLTWHVLRQSLSLQPVKLILVHYAIKTRNVFVINFF